MKALFRRRGQVLGLAAVLAAAALILPACKGKDSVTNDFKFADTKLIAAQINFDFKLTPNAGPALTLTTGRFLLNAFTLDSPPLQVAFLVGGTTAVQDLPVTMTSSHLSLDATLQVPATLAARPSGYAFKFVLKPVTAGLKLAGAASNTLAAFKGGIQANGDAAGNAVAVSVATSLAAQLAGATLSDPGSDASLSAYASLVTLLGQRLQTVEATADGGKAQELQVYASAMAAGLELQILTDKSYQKQVADALSAGAPDAATPAGAASAQAFATGLTTTLQSFAGDTGTLLGTASTPQLQVFKPNTIDPTKVPTTSTYGGSVLAPVGIIYAGPSATVAGSVTITPSLVTTGIASYNAYFGGDSVNASRGKLIGNVTASALPLAVTVAAGTTVPAGTTKIWVYPVLAGGAELSWPTYTTSTFLVTATGDVNLAISPISAQVAYQTTQAFVVTPKTGYVLSTTVTGSCPAGSWNGSTYTTGQVTSACDLSFSSISNSAALGSLTISAGALTPFFNSSTLAYTVVEINSVTSLTVTPAVVVAGATLKVNGVTLASGSTSAAVPLSIGKNTITIVVTAADGKTQASYVLTVNRAGLSLITGQLATAVIGQTSFSGVSFGVTATTLHSPYDITIGTNGLLYIADWFNARILGYNAVPTAPPPSVPSADFVVGQTNLTTGALGTTATNFQGPQAVVQVGNQFAVMDNGSSRALLYNTVPILANSPPTPSMASVGASLVIGQSVMSGTSTGCSATNLNAATGLFLVNGKVIVTDKSNNRVLIFNQVPTSNAASADLVLGQGSMTTCASATTQTSLNAPRYTWSDGTRLVVSDSGNNRVLIWNTFPTSNGQAADLVLGQLSFTTGTANTGGQTAASLSSPANIYFNGLQLFVADYANHRALMWNNFPTSNKQAADVVLGQSSTTLSTNAADQSTMKGPWAFASDGQHLLVVDQDAHRVLVYTTN